MKKLIAIGLISLLPSFATAETVFKQQASVSTFAQNVGSRITIQVFSNKPSSFKGSFSQGFSYNNGTSVNSFAKNFSMTGNPNFNITSQFNNNTSIFTNSPNFKW